MLLLSSLPVLMLKNIILWNCRGVGNKNFVSHARLVLDVCFPELLILMETKISSSRGGGILKALGFDNWELVEGNGFAGGIWMAWRGNALDVDIIQLKFQFIHARLKPKSGDSLLFTVIYASPEPNLRFDLWKELELISQNAREPWLVAGDFNDIRDPFEKKGGVPLNWRRANLFNERINRCNLMDLETQGGHFTWKGPKNQGLDQLFKKLDRAMCSVDWRIKFGEACVKILP